MKKVSQEYRQNAEARETCPTVKQIKNKLQIFPLDINLLNNKNLYYYLYYLNSTFFSIRLIALHKSYKKLFSKLNQEPANFANKFIKPDNSICSFCVCAPITPSYG